MLESLKDENGQIKKPILFSLIGGAGLVGYLLISNRSSSGPGVTSTGDSSTLTDAIAALQAAIQGQAGGTNTGGGTGTTSLDPPMHNPIIVVKPPAQPVATGSRTFTPFGSTGGSLTTKTPGTVVTGTKATNSRTALSVNQLSAIKEVPATVGENGSAGGGGQGLITVPSIASVAGTIYGGLTHDQLTAIKEAPAPVVSAVKKVPGGPAAVAKLPLSVNKLSAIKEVPATTAVKGGVSTPISGTNTGGKKWSNA